MAVIECREVLSGRKGGVDEQGNTTLSRVFQVTTDAITDSPADVISGLRYETAGVPVGTVPIRLYDQHPQYKPCRLRTVDCSPTESPTTWLVSLDYRSAPFPAKQGELPVAPINTTTPQQPSNSSTTGSGNARPAPERPPEFSFTSREFHTAGEFYIDQTLANLGNKAAYVNSIGDQLEGLEVRKTNLVITVKYFSTRMTLAKIRERRGKINNNVWQGFDPGTLMVQDIQLESVYDTIAIGADGQEIHGLLWRCTVVLEESLTGWQTTILNAGRRYKPASGPNAGKLLPAVNADGSHATEPVPLKENGDLATTPADFFYKTFQDQPGFEFGSNSNPLLI